MCGKFFKTVRSRLMDTSSGRSEPISKKCLTSYISLTKSSLCSWQVYIKKSKTNNQVRFSDIAFYLQQRV